MATTLLPAALISSSPLVLAGLRAGLAQQGGFDIVLAAASLAQARQERFAQARVAVIDLAAPDDAAAEAEPFDLDADAGPALLLLAPDPSPALDDWLADGLSVLPRHAPIGQIAAAARAAAAGLVATSRPLAAEALRIAGAGPASRLAGELEPLTPREQEVLAQMSLGLGNREIAQALHISPHTAKFHVAQIIAKLDASSRAHAVAKALRAGLVAL